MTQSIMIQGTMSSVGKSMITAGLCRILKQDGFRVAPFKAQNMALNSFITNDGLEMGRAQAVQAEAACIKPSILMNPILLKPTNDTGSQVIINGEVYGNISAANYDSIKPKLRTAVCEAYRTLAAQYDIIVIEGAGSPAEINLKDDDIVNMGMAQIADAPVLLVGDIDRGGVFASVYGTIALLDETGRKRIKGVIINKFRGDVEILRPGLAMMEEMIHTPVIGVVPYLNLDIDDEDSVTERLAQRARLKPLDIAVIRLPRISNFTDFSALTRMEPVGLRYAASAGDLGSPDLIILPGTKNTMGDLMWLRQNGLEAAIKKLSATGTPVIGICGGYQMLGMTLFDPDGLEQGGRLRGMELLPVDTEFAAGKVRTRISGKVKIEEGTFAPLCGAAFQGYEIHMGKTVLHSTAKPFAALSNGTADGAVCQNVFGSYVHGLFDDNLGIELVKILCSKKGIDGYSPNLLSTEDFKQQQYDALADALRKSLNIKQIYRIMGMA